MPGSATARNRLQRNLVRTVCSCLLCASLSASADPPLVAPDRASGDSSTPTIAVVTLQAAEPAQDNATGVAPAPAPDPGIRFEDLSREIGARIRVTTRGQRTHLGVIRAADAQHVTLSVRRHGGSATYVLKRDQIERIDPG